jgi:hypothetical protein
MLYYLMFIVFMGLVIAPVIVGPKLMTTLIKSLGSTLGPSRSGLDILQPIGASNNNTNGSHTGAALFAGQGDPHATDAPKFTGY